MFQTPSPPDHTSDFIKEEQKQRRQDIEAMGVNVVTDQKTGLLITGAIWSWLAAHPDQLCGTAQFVLLLPPVIMAFFAVRWLYLHKSIKFVAAYTEKLEDHFNVPPALGWER